MTLAEIGNLSSGFGASEAKCGNEDQVVERMITSFIENHRDDPDYPGDKWVRSAFMLTRELSGVTGYENRVAIASGYTNMLGFDNPEDLLRSLMVSSCVNFRKRNHR